MSKIIPTYPQKAQRSQRFTFGGKQWICRYTWRERPGAWYFDLFYADGTPAMLGRRLIGGMSPDASIYNEAFPPGKFFTYGPEVYTRYDLNQSLLPMFIPNEEIIAPDDEFEVFVLEGDQSPPFEPVDPPGFCEIMAQIKAATGGTFDDLLLYIDVMVYACDELFIGDDPYVQLDEWYNEGPFEGSNSFDSPIGDVTKVLAMDYDGVKYVRTNKEGGLETGFHVNAGDGTNTNAMLLAFRLKNVPSSTRNVYRMGTVSGNFYIRANSDQTLTISGIAGTIPYEIDQLYVVYMQTDGAGNSFIYVDDDYHDSSVEFSVQTKTFRIGEAGSVTGLDLEFVTVIVDRAPGSTVDNLVLNTSRVKQVCDALSLYYGYAGGLQDVL